MTMNTDRSNQKQFAIDEEVTHTDWVIQILDSNLRLLDKIDEALVTKRDTTKGKVGLRSDVKNAEIILDKVREYELPKVDNAADIRRVDDLLTRLSALINEKDALLKRYGA